MMQRKRSPIKRLSAPGSLKFQLLTRSLFILAVLLLLLGVLQHVITRDFLYRSNADAMKAQIMSLPSRLFHDINHPNRDMNRSIPPTEGTEESYPPPEGESGENRENMRFLFMPDTSLAYIALDGTFTDLTGAYGASPPQLSASEYQELSEEDVMSAPATYKIVTGDDGREQLVVFALAGPPGMNEGILQMGIGTETLNSQLLQQLMLFLLLSVLALAGGSVLYLPVLRRTLVPLSRVVDAVEQTDAGNLSERLPTNQGQQEIDRLAVSFNGMLERLEASFEAEREAKERMRRFVADASHELRTPLTSIHGFLEVLLRGAATKPEQLEAALRSMHGESKRINKLVEDLLLLAKLDQEPGQVLRTDTRLDILLRDMMPQLEMLAGKRSIQVELHEGTHAMLDPDKMKQVVLNLVHNAVQHTDPEQGVIEITLKRNEEQQELELSIGDNGSGIAEEHLSHVFDRFYRSDSSRTRKYGGAGLGLPISQSIVEAHGGTILVESEHGKGTVFRIRLPLELHAS